ncbi:fluoride efflux transporter FluC [Subtercola boreus]|uniref:Fluoride-specific ion channel FluC n=1 Tax=Subtercola boreus TaxID=120213 RepID=A0A3E0W9Z4_9MICO|nr:CrcB family protein [Subtercola boreus]RFA20618.1 hypothetical protein B7R24_09310 [Subtercola boreus]RFA20732.1 hypothetical protein B7R23_09245 [Subtercola boreus]RFA26943.1 hypothetical protein B7R25_09375 [Subtercola boreus]
MTDPRRDDEPPMRRELPFDSDVEVDDDDVPVDSHSGGPVGRPAHHRPALLLAVGIGGAAGTLARYLLQQAVMPWQGLPVITVGINLLGAFLLGLLLESLMRAGGDHGSRRVLRLLLGTGVLGGFTSYSALSVDTVTLLHAGEVGLAVLYALGTVVVGAVASVLGIAAGAAGYRRVPGGGPTIRRTEGRS